MNTIIFKKTAEILSAINDLSCTNNVEKAINEACDIIKTVVGKKDFVLITSVVARSGLI